jgi:hypothetical protein
MLEIGHSDLSFRTLARECARRRGEIMDEFQECVAGILAVALVLAVPFYGVFSGGDVSLVEASQAAEPVTGGKSFEAPPMSPTAVLNRLETDRLGPAEVRAIQTELKRKGFDPGPIDGIAGKRTLSALNRYRQTVHLAPAQIVSRESAGVLRAQ